MKTHYRKAFKSPYLSSADIVEPTIFTIKHVKLEIDKTKKTQEMRNTAYFEEKEIRPGEELKPMVLNVGNSRIMKNLTSSAFIDDWNNVPVTIYVNHNVKFGRDVVDGLRLSTEHPKMKLPALTPKDTERWDRAVKAYKTNGNLDIVKQHVSISPENEKQIIKEAEDVASD